jgi:hypothetical protein
MRRDPEALARARERREKDDAAPRLNEVVTNIKTLKLQIDEKPKAADDDKAISHTKIIIVRRAPARFELPCCDHKCDGSHDFTEQVLEGLKAGKKTFSAIDVCGGTAKEGPCPFEMKFTAIATYT